VQDRVAAGPAADGHADEVQVVGAAVVILPLLERLAEQRAAITAAQVALHRLVELGLDGALDALHPETRPTDRGGPGRAKQTRGQSRQNGELRYTKETTAKPAAVNAYTTEAATPQEAYEALHLETRKGATGRGRPKQSGQNGHSNDRYTAATATEHEAICAAPGCSTQFPPQVTGGRVKRYCSDTCRFRAHRARQAEREAAEDRAQTVAVMEQAARDGFTSTLRWRNGDGTAT
jgi:hypothetical protein